MIDNINGFVPQSSDPDPSLNGHQPADGSEQEFSAHYSPISGLSGGPEITLDAVPEESAQEGSDEPALVEPIEALESAEQPGTELLDEAAEHIEAGIAVDATESAPSESVIAGEPAAPADQSTDVLQESVEPDPTQPLPVGRPPSPLELDAQIESLLFVADGPAQVGKLAEALEVKVDLIEAALALLEERYAGRGISIQRIKDRVQLTTSATAAPLIQRFLGLSATAPLSKAALETLAIIAYRQPITRPQIEQIRGVNSDSVIKNLLTKGLVEETGIAEGPGRPVLYATTPEFLQHFGLSALTELPALNLDDMRRQFASDILKG